MNNKDTIMRNILAFLIILDLFFVSGMLCNVFVMREVPLWFSVTFSIALSGLAFFFYWTLTKGRNNGNDSR